MRKTPYYQTIHDHILNQIHTGVLKKEDTLATIGGLCARYSASPNTIRAVMRKLSEEGYISTGRGKATTVISVVGDFRQSIGGLCARSGEIAKAFDFLCLLLPSMASFGGQKLGEGGRARVFRILRAMGEATGDILRFRELRKQLIHQLLSKTGNFMMVEAVDRAEEITMLPKMIFETMATAETGQPLIRKRYHQQMLRAAQAIQDGFMDKAKREIASLYLWKKEATLSILRQLAADYSFPLEEGHMDVGRRGYLYDMIVSGIIDKFYEGAYDVGDYLPSESAMCARYQVSLPTVRKAYQVLAGLGVVKTINGKGTQVTLFSEGHAAGSPFFEELPGNLERLLETLQLITVTVGDVALCAAAKMSAGSVVAMIQKIESLWESKRNRRMHTIPILLFEIEKAARHPALDIYFHELKQNLIWSLYLDRLSDDADDMWERKHFRCLEALTELESGDIARFRDALVDIMEGCLLYYQRRCKALPDFNQ